MIEMKLSPIEGVYFFKSPYHKKKTMLPFLIKTTKGLDKERPIEVSTVEYKGYKRSELASRYPVKTIKEFFLSGVLIAKGSVSKSSVLSQDKYLLW